MAQLPVHVEPRAAVHDMDKSGLGRHRCCSESGNVLIVLERQRVFICLGLGDDLYTLPVRRYFQALETDRR